MAQLLVNGLGFANLWIRTLFASLVNLDLLIIINLLKDMHYIHHVGVVYGKNPHEVNLFGQR